MTVPFRVRLLMLVFPGLLLSACNRNGFHASGYIASDGGPIGKWREPAAGCSRDPFDGAPIGDTRTVATFLFEDHTTGLSEYQRLQPTAPNPLLRMQIDHEAGGYSATLSTYRIKGTLLDARNCTLIRVTTREQPPDLPKARSRLGGTVELDCSTRGSHITGNLRFDRCAY